MKKRSMLSIALVFVLSLLTFSAWAAPGDSPGDPIYISTPAELDDMRIELDKHYKLSNDIDLTAYLASGAGYTQWGAAGWMPIGLFTGGFDGNNHVIRGLWIDRTEWNVGLFETVSADISNLGVEIPAGSVVSGDYFVGGLAGEHIGGKITNCYTTGDVRGTFGIGGLLGFQRNGGIVNCRTSGNISGHQEVGGLVGKQEDSSVEKCYATGNIAGGVAGGLVGYQSGSSLKECYATGNVVGYNYTGGLAGYQKDGRSDNCYATGNVTGTTFVGGLIGSLVGSAERCYATGKVSGDEKVGGLIGEHFLGRVECSYAVGNVSGDEDVGGVVGNQYLDSVIGKCYRYIDLTLNGSIIPITDPESSTSGRHGGIVTAEELMTKTTYEYNNWQFNDFTEPGPWYWDPTGFPKLNMGAENFPFPFGILPVVSINVQPQSTTVTAGSIAGVLSVSASVTNGGALVYQWYSNTTYSYTDSVSIPGATNASLTIPTSLTAGTYYYYCIVSSAGATPVTSDVAIISVLDSDSGGCNTASIGYLVIMIVPLVFGRKMRKSGNNSI